MQTTLLELSGLVLIEPQVFRDPRGFFFESYNRERYRAAGIDCEFLQDNHSSSQRHTLRGMHFQTTPGQAKLVRVAVGKVWDVAVDIRPASPTFGKWTAVELDDTAHKQLFIPVGFAHGFVVLSERAEFLYKVSSVYDPKSESGFLWNDPEVGIRWPIAAPLVSQRDAQAQSFAAFRKSVGR